MVHRVRKVFSRFLHIFGGSYQSPIWVWQYVEGNLEITQSGKRIESSTTRFLWALTLGAVNRILAVSAILSILALALPCNSLSSRTGKDLVKVNNHLHVDQGYHNRTTWSRLGLELP